MLGNECWCVIGFLCVIGGVGVCVGVWVCGCVGVWVCGCVWVCVCVCVRVLVYTCDAADDWRRGDSVVECSTAKIFQVLTLLAGRCI